MRSTLFIVTILFLSVASISHARSIPENVKLAAIAMYAAAGMEPSDTNKYSVQYTGTHACNDMGGNPCKAWYRDFDLDLNYYVSVHKDKMYIAFRGTHGEKNEALNQDGKPIHKHGRWVHQGWWNAKNRAWKKLKPYIKKYGKKRKIIITGHSMGAALAAYLTKTLLHHKTYKKYKIRLVTFGAPRYTTSVNFFPRKKTFYVYTMETLYKDGKKWRTDPYAFKWEKALQDSGNLFFKNVDTKRPKDKRKRTWTAKCKADSANKETVHGASVYYSIATSGTCKTK